MVENSPSMHKTLGSTPSAGKNKPPRLESFYHSLRDWATPSCASYLWDGKATRTKALVIICVYMAVCTHMAAHSGCKVRSPRKRRVAPQKPCWSGGNGRSAEKGEHCGRIQRTVERGLLWRAGLLSAVRQGSGQPCSWRTGTLKPQQYTLQGQTLPPWTAHLIL